MKPATILATVLLLGWSGPGTPPHAAAQEAADIEGRIAERLIALGETGVEQKDRALDLARQTARLLESRVETLKSRAETLAADQQIASITYLGRLEGLGAQVRDQIDDLAASADIDFIAMRRSLADAIREMDSVLREAAGELSP